MNSHDARMLQHPAEVASMRRRLTNSGLASGLKSSNHRDVPADACLAGLTIPIPPRPSSSSTVVRIECRSRQRHGWRGG